MGSFRKQKINSLMKEIIGDALIKEVKDPRIGFVSVSKVEISSDYSYADVWVSVLGDEKDLKKSLQGLEASSKYIQFIVGRELPLRVTPHLRFKYDESIANGCEMVDVIDEAVKKDKSAREHTTGSTDSSDETSEKD